MDGVLADVPVRVLAIKSRSRIGRRGKNERLPGEAHMHTDHPHPLSPTLSLSISL